MINSNTPSNFMPFHRHLNNLVRIASNGHMDSLMDLLPAPGANKQQANLSGRKNTFSLALGETAQILGPDFFDRLRSKIGESQILPKLYKRDEKDLYVDWDESGVFSTNDGIFPYTGGLVPCIAILIRAYHPTNHEKPAYLSVIHVYSIFGINKFESCLESLIEKTHLQGMQIFLCGGYNRAIPGIEDGVHRKGSNSLHDQIVRFANSKEVPILQDLVGLADAGGKTGKNQAKFSFFVELTGFDRDYNPYAIINTIGPDLLPDCRPIGRWSVMPKVAEPSFWVRVQAVKNLFLG